MNLLTLVKSGQRNRNSSMIKKLFLIIIFILSMVSVRAQNSPEELGERIFDLFRNESYNFREVLPTTDQLIDKVETIDPELAKNRMDDYRKDYSNKVKGFNEKCEYILEKGSASGIVWHETELDSIKPYRKNIGVKNGNQTATIEITKLCIYFSFKQREFVITIDAVIDYNNQYLVSNDAIILEELSDSFRYKP
jgi:hypothetical protein